MKTLIETRGLRKSFALPAVHWKKSRLLAVDDVTLAIREGVNWGLVGESGSGKTTLARLLVRLIRPEAGGVYFNGRDLAQLSSDEYRIFRQSVQMVFQDPYSSLDPRYTVYRILAEALSLTRGLSRQEAAGRMVKTLAEVGLKADVLTRFPHEFSGGERQRIAIARALLLTPRLLILDEAVSSLDVLIQAQIIELLKELQKRHQVTYLFVSHNLRVVRKLCQHIAVMYQGKIVESAETEEIFMKPVHPYTQGLLAAALDYKVPADEEPLV